MVQEWQRGEHVSRQYAYHDPRHTGEAGRFREVADRRVRPDIEIHQALESHCGIPVRQSFTAVLKPDGSIVTYFSPGRPMHDYDGFIAQFFDSDRFKIAAIRELSQNGTNTPLDTSMHMRNGPPHPNRMAERRRLPSGGDDWEHSHGSDRKRQRGQPAAREDDSELVIPVVTRRPIPLAESESVRRYYEHQFKNCQQSACKLIAKAWIKLLEPKKQSTHPYTGQDEAAPLWWPRPPEGAAKSERVRHREPDHLYKPERLKLLVHILRLVMKPDYTQLPNLQIRDVNISKLEEVTTDALSSWYAASSANSARKMYINEVLRVAKLEEKYLKGEIDGTAEVWVKPDDGSSNSQASENEETRASYDEDAEVLRAPKASSSVPSEVQQYGHAAMHAPSTINELPVRGPPFPSSGMMQYLPTPQQQQHQFNDHTISSHAQPGVNSSLPLEMVPGASQGRRSSFAADYPNQTVHNQAYQQQPWNPVSSNPSSSTMYAYSHSPQPQTTPQPYTSAPVQIAPPGHPPYLPTPFDGFTRPDYEANGSLYRTSDISSSTPSAGQIYGYNTDSRGIKLSSPHMATVPRHQGE